MQNIDVRFRASSDFAKVRADLGALEAQAAALNETLSKGAYGAGGKTPPILDAGRWAQSARAVEVASKTYRDAASSSGLLTTQQIRATSEAEKFTKALQAQKLSMGDMIKNRGIMRQVYSDQLRMQRMTAQFWGTDTQGRAITDITLPKNVPTELDNWRRRMGMFGNMAASAGTQIVNLGKNIQWSGRQLTVGFTYPMALFGAAAGIMAYKVENAFASINKVYDFSAKAQMNEAQMSKEQGDLRVKSLKMATIAAQQYGSTIESTLKVEQELAATGLKGNQLMSTTSQVQRISTLGDIDPEQTEKMVISMQTAFRKTIPDAKSLTDNLNFMNAASNATSLSLQDIATAVPRAASAFASLGGNAKQMTVLLVAMRESGVEAAQGANALKSATARALNPPKGAIDAWAQYNINISDLAKKAGGNLFDFLKLVGVAQQKIQGTNAKNTQYLREQAIAALFGTYQFNRLNAALVNVGDAYGGVNNQTSKALALMHESPAALAAIAESSRKAMMDNPAGKLREEWALLQIQLQAMGQPFLKAAAEILGFITKVIKGFNSLNSSVKAWAMRFAAAVALAGPLIMITGLMLNLTGQFLKGVASVAKFVGISKLMTKEEAAAALSTEAQNKAVEQQVILTNTLADEIAVMVEAMTAAKQQLDLAFSGAADGEAAMSSAVQAATDAVVAGEKTQQEAIQATIAEIEAKAAVEAEQAKAFASYGHYTPLSTPVIPPQAPVRAPNTFATGFRGESIIVPGDATAEQAAQNKMIAAKNEELAVQTELNNKANAQTVIQTKTGKVVNGTSLGMGVMAASMATMMFDSNKTAQRIAEWAMIGVIAVPAVKGLVVLMSSLNAKTIMESRLVTGLAARWAAMTELNAAAGGGAAGIKAALGGLGADLGVAATGVAGITLGITAVVAGVYLWDKHLQAVTQHQIDIQTSLTNMADDWGTAMGKVKKQYDGIKAVAQQIKAIGYNPNQFQKDLTYYQTGNGKTSATNFAAQTPDKQDLTGMNTYINLIQDYGLTAKEAQGNVTAMLVAGGEGFVEAQTRVKAWAAEVKGGSKNTLDMNNALGIQAQFLKRSTDDINTAQGRIKSYGDASKNFAELWANAFTEAKTPSQAKDFFNRLKGQVDDGWKTLYDNLVSNPDYQAFLKANNITDPASLEKFGLGKTSTMTPVGSPYSRQSPTQQAANMGIPSALVQEQKEYENTLIAAVASTLQLKGNIKSIAQLQDSWFSKARQMNYGQIVKQTKDIANSLVSGPMGAVLGLSDKQFAGKNVAQQFKEALANIPQDQLQTITDTLTYIAEAKGVKVGATAWQTYKNILMGANHELDDTKNKVDNVSKALHDLPSLTTATIQVDQVGGIVKSAMGGVEADMVASADAKLQAAQSAASTALGYRQQAAQTAQQNRQQAAQTAQEARFKKQQDDITKAFQKRIDGVNNEIKAEQNADAIRQQLYDKEKARIQQLADLQNNTIDFNQAIDEGRLQDAAKTANTAEAQTMQNEMDNELAAEQNRMQARVDALNKKSARLTKQKDKELANLQKVQDAEKAHLAKMQQMQDVALQKRQAAETAALQATQDAEKASLDARMALFQAYTAKDKQDLDKWIVASGNTWDTFGKSVMAKGKSWSEYFQTSLQQHIQAAGMQVLSDNMWSKIGGSMATQLLKGIGFAGKGAFEQFVKTGLLPKSFGKANAPAHHGGGVVGGGGTGRGGRSGGLGRGERYILAEDGEMVVNKHASRKYGSVLSAINKYSDGTGAFSPGMNPSVSVPTYKSFSPVVGLMSGAIAQMFEGGVSQSMSKAVSSIMKRNAGGRMGRRGGNPMDLGGYIPGTGGFHRPIAAGIPITQGRHDIGIGGPGWSAIDFGASIGHPVYATGNGTITSSYDIRGYEPRRTMFGVQGASVQDGFKSYGRVMTLHEDAGPDTLYGHLSRRGVRAGTRVRGGSVIGLSGNTGNVVSQTGNGAHLHFASDISPYAFLRKGGKLKWDNTMVKAHKGETMLSAPLTKAFEQNVAGGRGDEYNVTLDLRGAYIHEDVDIEKAVDMAIDKRQAKKGGTRVIRSKVGAH